jgi:membrane dipeptidase
VDGAAFEAAVVAGASDRELQDLREEMMMTRSVTDARERKEYLDAFRASGITCVFQNAGEEGNDPVRLLKRLARYTFVADLLRPELFKAVRPDDLAAAKQDGKLCLYLTTNGVPLLQRWETARDELGLIRVFFQAGVRAMHLTYNRRNPIGDGAGEARDGGLSDFGQAAIKEMNRVGVIVDVAHSGWRTAAEAAKASGKPVMASHTACAGLYHHIRAKPDDVLKAVCDTGGLFGICAIPRFLGGAGDIRVMLDHLDYAIKKFGPEHVAIATDVAYVSQFEEEERKKVSRRGGISPLALPPSRWEQLWPPGEFAAAPAPQAVLTTAWTNWPLFTVGLVQRGHSDETIRQVIGENALRVARANFPAVNSKKS